MRTVMLIGLLIGVTTTSAKPTDTIALRTLYIDRYFDNVVSRREQIQRFIETTSFRFDLKNKTGEMRVADGDVVLCWWNDRPSRALGTVPNISFTCDQNSPIAVSGVLDTEHLMMLMHVSMRDASFQADALVQMSQ